MNRVCTPLLAAILCAFCASSFGQDSSLVKALEIQPKQSDVDYDRPTPTEIKNCSIESAKARFNATGWVVLDANERVIRRFLDTNGDKQLDQWSYYKHGIEVYRDIDSNFDRKADQYRWMGTAGTRWGVDDDQDGTIDSWKMISAEEVSFEVVEAIRNRDRTRFNRLLISPTELKGLGVGKQQFTEIQKRSSSATDEFSKFARDQRVINQQSKWIHFGGMRPGVIPAGTDGSTTDILFYDSVAAVIDNGSSGHVQLSIGTLINVGKAWRVVDLPEPIVEGAGCQQWCLVLPSIILKSCTGH